MRIRRRPQAQQQSPYPPPPEQRPSDPFAAAHPPPPPPPLKAEEQRWELPLPADEAEQGKKRRIESGEGLHSQRPDADPAAPAATRPALPSRPQSGNVVGRSSSDDDHRPGHGRHGDGAQRQGAPAAAGAHARTHESLENGHPRAESERPVISAGERLIIPAMPVAPVNVKEGIKQDDRGGGAKKKRRGPPVLMEGSRCSRVNGRGWRCSQPTLVGYSLCEHHLGKGRQKSASRTEPSSWKNGGATLGRTEPSIRKKAPQPSVPVVTTAPTANGRASASMLGRTDPASGRKSVDALAAAAHDASDLSSLRAATLAAEVD